MLQFSMLKFWNEEDLYKLQVQAVSRFMKVDSQFAVEASIEFAKYLSSKGLDGDNYPLYLEILRDENRYVIEALIGKEKAFDLFTKVQPNPYIAGFCFQMLRAYAPGGVHDLTSTAATTAPRRGTRCTRWQSRTSTRRANSSTRPRTRTIPSTDSSSTSSRMWRNTDPSTMRIRRWTRTPPMPRPSGTRSSTGAGPWTA
jgi:hypothetical protein